FIIVFTAIRFQGFDKSGAFNFIDPQFIKESPNRFYTVLYRKAWSYRKVNTKLSSLIKASYTSCCPLSYLYVVRCYMVPINIGPLLQYFSIVIKAIVLVFIVVYN